MMDADTREDVDQQLAEEQPPPSAPAPYDGAEDDDPSARSGRGGRLNRKTVVMIFGIATIFATVAMAIIMFQLVNGNTGHARAAEVADVHQPSADASSNGVQQDMADARRAAKEQEDQDAQNAVAASGAGAKADSQVTDTAGGAAGASDTATPTPSPAQLAAQEREQHALDELRQSDQLASQAYTADAVVSGDTGDLQVVDRRVGGVGESAAAGDDADPPASPAPSPPATSSRYYIGATDYIDGLIVPNVNAERAGAIQIVVQRPVTNWPEHVVTLIPIGATIQAHLDASTVGSTRIGLVGVRVRYSKGGPWVDLGNAAVGDADGTLGVGAHVDNHTKRVLTIAAIGGALAGLAQGAFGGVTISTGGSVTASNPSITNQVLGGAGAGVLQQAGQMAQQASALAPTLTAPQARRVILTVDHDIPLEPYCNPDVPNSLECQVEELLHAANS